MPTNPDVKLARRACMANPNYFAETYVHTRDPHADVPVRKWPKYEYLRNALTAMAGRNAAGLEEGKPIIKRTSLVAIRKSRHLLFTWLLCVYMTLRCAFEPHREGMIQSQKEDKAKAVVGRIKFIVSELNKRSPWLLPSVPRFTTQSVVFGFPDGSESTIWSVPQGPDQVASYSPTIVGVDEAALQEHFRSTYYTALPAVREGGQFIGISTVRYGAWFNKKFCKIPAVKCITVHYRDHPGNKEAADAAGGWDAWKANCLKEYDEEDEGFWEREMEINEDATEGVPAFRPPFSRETHVASKPIVPDPTIPIVRGWDMGFHHPACIWFQVAGTGQIVVLQELLGKKQQLKDFVKEVKAISKDMDPYPNSDSFRDWCDPAAYTKQRSVAGPSEVEVLNEAGIYPMNDSRKVAMRPSIQLIKNNLALFKDRQGQMRPGTLFDPGCEHLIRGLNGAYASKDDTSEKFAGGLTEHVIDAFRYAQVGEFGLGGVKAA